MKNTTQQLLHVIWKWIDPIDKSVKIQYYLNRLKVVLEEVRFMFYSTFNIVKKYCMSNEPWHDISNNVVCATSKASDQPARKRSLIRAFASRLSILWLLSYWLNTIWSF